MQLIVNNKLAVAKGLHIAKSIFLVMFAVQYQKEEHLMITFPNAKINLGLNIVGKRADGYHNLQTVFYPIPLTDALEIEQKLPNGDERYTLHQSGVEIAGDPQSNLVVKAYELLASHYELPPIDIYLYKHIPSGAGLGGGSADAAFMLKLLTQRFELKIDTDCLERYAATLGADCAFFIRNAPTYAEGIGNIFSPISLSLQGYKLVLVKPNVFVSTKEAFAYVKPQTPVYDLKETIAMPITSWRERLSNDFELSVFKQFPSLAQIKDELYNMGAIYAAMSGSGSSLFGIFAPDAILPELHFGDDAFVYSCVL